MLRRALIATLLAAGGIGVYVGSATIPSDAPANVANLWVDTSGGTCTRQASPVEYSDAAACGSLDAANDACQGGDTVLVKGGSYGAQAFTGSNSRVSACTISEASGESASIAGGLKFGEPDTPAVAAKWLTVEGLAYTGSASMFEGVANITLRDVDGGSAYIRGVTTVLVEDSDFGPCRPAPSHNECGGDSASNSAGTPVKVAAGANGVTLRHNDIHDFENDPAPWDHWECSYLEGGQNVTFELNRYWNCDIYGIFMQPSEVTSNIVIQNNWFGQATNNAVVIGSNNATLTDVVIRFNSFADGYAFGWESGAFSNIRSVGNIYGQAVNGNNCKAGITYTDDVWKSGTCGTGSQSLAGGAPPYVNGSGTTSALDYHLTGAGGVADDLVPTSVADGCGAGKLTTDYDGDTRPAGAACDAGADER